MIPVTSTIYTGDIYRHTKNISQTQTCLHEFPNDGSTAFPQFSFDFSCRIVANELWKIINSCSIHFYLLLSFDIWCNFMLLFRTQNLWKRLNFLTVLMWRRNKFSGQLFEYNSMRNLILILIVLMTLKLNRFLNGSLGDLWLLSQFNVDFDYLIFRIAREMGKKTWNLMAYSWLFKCKLHLGLCTQQKVLLQN